MIHTFIIWLRERRTRKRLSQIVAQTRASESNVIYRKHRAAALSAERKAHIAKLIEGIPGVGA